MKYHICESDLWDLGFMQFKPKDIGLKKKDFEYRSEVSDHNCRALTGYTKSLMVDSGLKGYRLPNSPNRYITLRSPAANRTLRKEGSDNVIQRWHRDLISIHETTKTKVYLAVWSNCYPTLLKRPRGKVQYHLEDGHLYLVDNDRWVHKIDPAYKGKENRWFLRFWVDYDTTAA